jgi:hypothetical protein
MEVAPAQAARGDLIQLNNPANREAFKFGMHTAFVVSPFRGENVEVVDSNFSSRNDEMVRRHVWNPFAQARTYGLEVHVWRFGQVSGGGVGAADPIGALDVAQGALGGFIGVNGWTIDPDAPITSGQVHVYIDGPAGSGARGVALVAAVDRRDVAAAFPGAGAAHGYSTAIGGVSPGPHKIWVYLINIAGGGSNQLLTTADVTVPAVPAGSPFGALDTATGRAGGAARVTGWTIDPDTRTTPTQVHVYIDGPAGSGVRGVAILADVSRPDVGAVHRGQATRTALTQSSLG